MMASSSSSSSATAAARCCYCGVLAVLGALSVASAAPSASFDSNRPTALLGIGFNLNMELSYPSGEDLSNVTTIYSRVSHDGQVVANGSHPIFSDGFLETSLRVYDILFESTGNQDLVVELAYSPDFSDASSQVYTAWVITGFVSVLPPLFVVAVAIVSQDVLWALYTGLFVAGAIVAQGNLLAAFLRTLDNYMVNSLGNVDHAYVILFSWFLAGLVAVVQKSGGGHGIANAIVSKISSRRSLQLSVFLLGFIIFFDDYANTLILGSTMRGISDAFFVSREKLAFIVDATTAPVASIAPISSWIGFEVGLINEQIQVLVDMGYGPELEEAGITSGYNVFLKSIVSRFYPIFMLMFQLGLIVFRRDAGPMLKAERRAMDKHQVSSPDAKESEVALDTSLEPAEDTPKLWWNSVVPILVTLVMVFLSLILTGYNNTLADGMEVNASNIFGNGDAYGALLWGAFIGSISSWVLIRFQYQYQGKLYNQWQHWAKFQFKMPVDEDGLYPKPILTFRESLAVWIEGIKGLTTPVLVLIMAWAIGQAVQDVSCDLFFASALSSDSLDPRMLPTLTFLIAALISFCTGTSWGTMSIMFPLVVPAAWISSRSEEIFVLVVSAVLAGAVFGDHATAISDTTILSSMATKCDLRHHVITQLPYALLMALVSIVIGYIPAAYAYPSYAGLLIGLVLVFLAPLVIAERVDHPARRMDPLSRGVEWIAVNVFKREPAEVYIPTESDDDFDSKEQKEFGSPEDGMSVRISSTTEKNIAKDTSKV